tara:strand:+ start:35 stop:520 length:486 start_codon:yes stop_codon:yes gene_type:complete
MSNENKSFTEKEIKDLWQTPIEVFKTLNKEFKFNCDVAASKKNNLCSKYIDDVKNALISDWGTSNWCNPPYSNINPWVDKAISEYEKGNTTVMLVPSDTSVKWFKKAFDSCSEVRFISGRISFINCETGKPVNGNNKGSVLFIWSNKFDKVSLINRSDLYK